MSVPTHSARCGRLLRAFILLFAGTALIASLYPLRLPESLGAVWDSFGFELSARLGDDPLFSVVQRAVLFVPLGLLLHRCLRLGRLPLPLLRAWALASLLCLGIELLQPLLSERHARLADLALASAMAGLGATLSSLSIYGWRFALGLLFAAQALAAGLLLGAHQGAGIADWDCGFPLLVGNENTLGRGWRGQISGLALYPRRLGRAEIAQLASTPMDSAGAMLRVRLGAGLASIPMSTDSGAAALVNANPKGPVLLGAVDSAGPPHLIDGDMVLDGRGVLRSVGAPSELCRDIQESRAFSLEALVRSHAKNQSGPARIVSLSANVLERNFTLGQAADRLVFRVRTGKLGSNGDAMPLATPGLDLVSRPRHLLVSFSGGVARMYVDGRLVRAPHYWHSTIPLRWQLWLRVDAILLVLGVGLGLLSWWALESIRQSRRAVSGFFLAAAPVAGFDAGLALWFGHHPDPGLHLALAIGVVLGLALSWSVASGRPPQPASSGSAGC